MVDRAAQPGVPGDELISGVGKRSGTRLRDGEGVGDGVRAAVGVGLGDGDGVGEGEGDGEAAAAEADAAAAAELALALAAAAALALAAAEARAWSSTLPWSTRSASASTEAAIDLRMATFATVRLPASPWADTSRLKRPTAVLIPGASLALAAWVTSLSRASSRPLGVVVAQPDSARLAAKVSATAALVVRAFT